MNRIHSINKRQRRRQEFTDLQDQVARLELANVEARRAKAELERLVAVARAIVAGVAREVPADIAASAGYLQGVQFPPLGPIIANSSAISDSMRSSNFNSGVGSASSGFLAASPKHRGSEGNLSNVLAALEPDPIAPSLALRKSALSALEPDPIAPSQSGPAAASRGIDSEDLAHLRQALTAWDGRDGSGPLCSNGNYDSSTFRATRLGPSLPGVDPMNVPSSSSVAFTMFQQSESSFSGSRTLLRGTNTPASAGSAPMAQPSLLSLQTFFPFFYRPPCAASSQALLPSDLNLPQEFASLPNAPVRASPGVDSRTSANQCWPLPSSRGDIQHSPNSPSPAGPPPRAPGTLPLPFQGNAGSESIDLHDPAPFCGYTLTTHDGNDSCEQFEHHIDWDSLI
jgi:hypothetical protein